MDGPQVILDTGRSLKLWEQVKELIYVTADGDYNHASPRRWSSVIHEKQTFSLNHYCFNFQNMIITKKF